MVEPSVGHPRAETSPEVSTATAGLAPIDYRTRLDRLRAALHERSGLTTMLLVDPISLRWCSGFRGSTGWLVVGPDRAVLGVDPRYLERAADELAAAGTASQIEIRCMPSGTNRRDEIAEVIGRTNRCGASATRISHAEWSDLSGECLLEPVDGVLEDLRRVKDSGEIARMELAARVAQRALAQVGPTIRPGLTELELRTELEYRMRLLGAEDAAYPTIVAAGPEHSARPHHAARERLIEEGDLLVIDIGASIDGYLSDMTRTFVVGDPSPEIVERYDLVKRAQAAGLAAVTPAGAVREIDSACRSIVELAGLAEDYLHIAGHGVGLEIHEIPFHSPASNETLRVGDVVTVEPGLYRKGLGGIRIEDLVVVTTDGHHCLSTFPKDTPCLPSPPTT